MLDLAKLYKNNEIFVGPDCSDPSGKENTLTVTVCINRAEGSLVMPPAGAETNSVLKADHGFKLVKLADGKPGIEVTITRKDNTQAKIRLCEGARGKWYAELEAYGKDNLNGAILISDEDFEAVVDSLFKAIKGFTVLDGVLQTADEALQKAFEIVTEGVRRKNVWSWVEFYVDGGGGVSGRRVDDYVNVPHDHVFRNNCAAFVSPPAESK